MRDALDRLYREFAFQTSGRFDLLPVDHLPFATLGAADVDGDLTRCIERGEGVVSVVGRMGSGKSSLIAAVVSSLDEGFVPLRVSVIGVEAGDPAEFARHAIVEIRDLPDSELAKHEERALDRAVAEKRVDTRERELRAGFAVGAGAVFTARVVGDIKRAAREELVARADPGDSLRGMQRLLDVFWKLKRCPVLIIEDTDHWGGAPDLANSFFDQTARAFGGLDAVTIVAAQTDYTNLGGYLRVRDKLAAEVVLPRLPDVQRGISRIIESRMRSVDVDARIPEIIDADGMGLLAQAYAESVQDGHAGDLRRTLSAMRVALEVALSEPAADRISGGHVEEALARTPLAPTSGLVTA